MLSYYFSIKTYLSVVRRNEIPSSKGKSHLRRPIYSKNSWRVTRIYTARLTKLVLHSHLTLDLGSKLIGNGPCKWCSSTRMYRAAVITHLGSCNEQIYMKQRPKYIYGGILGTLGHPKGSYVWAYGDRNPVRGLGFRCFSSAPCIIDSSSVGLEELTKVNKKNPDHLNDKLIHIVSSVDTLILAFELIKNNPGNSTPGVNNTTLDKIGLKWFHETSRKIKAGKYKFKPARRVYIDKVGSKGKKRPITISCPRDKIVQKAILLVLDAIFEPSFLTYSHGSRQNRGTHTALEYIKFNFKEAKWAIEADIDNNFPSINHRILMRLLGKRILCCKFLSLIKGSIKAGYIENSRFFESNVGLFQGNIMSPMLNNIYLHELDVFMDDLIKSFRAGKSRRKNPVFRRLQYLMEKSKGNLKEVKKLRKLFHKTNSKDPQDPGFKRLYYVRYVDDFVVGLIGSHKNSVMVLEQIRSFLLKHLKLTLNADKTIITNFSKRHISFLGTHIKGTWERDKKIVLVKKDGIIRKVRVTGRTVLKAPIKNLFEKAASNGFFKRRGDNKFVPSALGRCINFDHDDILRYYNSVILGTLHYYSFANNRKSLGSFIHGIKFSCARTLALKYKIRYASKAFSRFGSVLKKSPDSKIQLFIPKTFKAIKEFNINAELPDKFIFSNWNKKMTRSNLYKSCVVCNSFENVEMHHVRKIRDLKSKHKSKKIDFFTMQMAAINRKQVPLCTKHHHALHNNKLSKGERQLFATNIQMLKKEKIR